MKTSENQNSSDGYLVFLGGVLAWNWLSIP